MKKTKIIKHILLFIILFIIILLFFSTFWATNTFAFINFDEILFQLTSPIKSTESSILIGFLLNSLLITIIVTIIVYLLLKELYQLLSYNKYEIQIKIFSKKIKFYIKSIILKTILKNYIS